MNDGSQLPPADLEALIEYIDGNLDEERALAFEGRLQSEPELLRAFEEFERIDRFQRRHVRRRPLDEVRAEFARSEQTRPLLFWGGLAAAASIALVGGVYWWLRQDRPLEPLRFEVAVLGIKDASPERVNQVLGLDENMLPQRMRNQRGPDEPALPSDPEYLIAALPAQETRAREALAAQAPSVTAGRFAIVLLPERDAWALVVAVPPEGQPARLFPLTQSPGSAERLQARELAFLPRPFVVEQGAAEGAPRAEFDYGFLVPLGAGKLRVLTSLSEEPLTPKLLAEVDQRLSSSSGTPVEVARLLSAWLAERGFSVGETLTVEEGN